MWKFAKRFFKYTCIPVAFLVILSAFSSKNSMQDSSSLISTTHYESIWEETISPNKNHVTSDKDIVNYTIQIFQNKEHRIIVNADSNSAFFEKMQYVLDYDKPISETDIDIQWTTLMGNTESTEENQLAIAHVSIFSNNEVFSQRKINFFNQGIENVTDTIKQKNNKD